MVKRRPESKTFLMNYTHRMMIFQKLEKFSRNCKMISIIGPAPWSPAHSSPANYSVQKCFVSIPVRLRPEIVKDSWIALDISRGANKYHNERKVCLMKLNAKDMYKVF